MLLLDVIYIYTKALTTIALWLSDVSTTLVLIPISA